MRQFLTEVTNNTHKTTNLKKEGAYMQNLTEEIKEIVVEIMEVEPDEIKMDTHFINDLGADSLKALEVMATLEKKYKIQIPEELLKRMVNLKSVIEVVEEVMAKVK
jgi:acyl carrier protein